MMTDLISMTVLISEGDSVGSIPIRILASSNAGNCSITTKNMSEIVCVDPKFWDCPSLSSDEHISATLGKPIELPESTDWASRASECEDELLAHFKELTGEVYCFHTYDNSYNLEHDFDSEFYFTIAAPCAASDYAHCHDVFVIINKHLGGDVRGNYGPFAVYRVDNLAETGFFDWKLGWYVSPVNQERALDQIDTKEIDYLNQQFSAGYSSCPTSQVRDQLLNGVEPTWSERLNCFVARFENLEFVCRLEVCEPYYS